MRTILFSSLKIYLSILIVVLVSSFSFSQVDPNKELGYYNIRNYTIKEYGLAAQNWGIAQDSRGVMYFANNLGMLEYNGVSWKDFSLSSDNIVRSLAIDSKNTIYAGALGEIGFFKPDKSGKLVITSLTDKIPEQYRDFADVWKVFIDTKDNAYFFTNKFILKWDGSKITTIDSKLTLQNMFYRDDVFFVHTKEKGLMKLTNDKLAAINGGDFFIQDKIYAILPYKQDNYLVVTRQRGLFLMPQKLNDISAQKIIPFKTEIDNFLLESPVYNAIRLSDNLFSLGTLGGGVVIIDDKGKLVKYIGKDEGLQDATVFFQYLDQHQNLWLGLSNGISRVDINSPLSLFGENGGLNGAVNAVTRHQDKIFAATNVGLFCLEVPSANSNSSSFEHATFIRKNPEISTECWDLFSFHSDKYNSLLIATTNGVFELVNNKIKLLIDKSSNVLLQSKIDKNRVFIGYSGGVASIYFRNGSWQQEVFASNSELEVISLVESNSGILWVGTLTNGLKMANDKMVNQKLSHFELLPTSLSTGVVYLKAFQDKLLIGTDNGLFSTPLNAIGAIKPEGMFGKELTDTIIGIHRMEPVSDNKIWMVLNNEKGNLNVGYYKKTADGKFIWLNSAFQVLGGEITYDIFHENNVTWLGGTYGLYRFDENQENDTHRDYNTIINLITIGKDSAIFNGVYTDANGNFSSDQTEDFKLVLPYKYNSLVFNVSATNFEYETNNRYSYYLEGLNDTWSDWKKDPKETYTNLDEGTYYFHVKAKNIYNHISKESVYEFTVLPPWHRTWWAYSIYVLALIAFILGAIRYTTTGLRNIIKRQTAEVVRQKEEIERKSKDITDSIHYAKRIQTAILPNSEDIAESLPDSFILFKPRDVVSGDFYWFANSFTENESYTIIAAADCTGHGVPGAFMSMIGNTILNEIVVTNKIHNPSEILSHLHIGVKTALKQHETESRDGMDIAILAFDNNRRKLYYSGANRPLWIVSDGVLKELKPTKAAIGGLTIESQVYELHDVVYKKGDAFYISTDGYADQFGGEEGKKFMTKKFKETIVSAEHLKMAKQKEVYDNTIEKWRGNHEQVDDILVIGIRI